MPCTLTVEAGFTELDRWLSIAAIVLGVVAIVLGVIGIWRAEHLFKKLDANLTNLLENLKKNTLREAITVVTSYAAFTRALQAVDLDPMELPKDGAFALLTCFHLQKLVNTHLTPEELSALHKLDRENVDKAAYGYVDLLIKSGMGKMKPDVELNIPSR